MADEAIQLLKDAGHNVTFDEMDRAREQALKSSRDIIIGCRKAIQCIHRDMMKDAKSYIKKSSAKLKELHDLTKDHADLCHAGFVENEISDKTWS